MLTGNAVIGTSHLQIVKKIKHEEKPQREQVNYCDHIDHNLLFLCLRQNPKLIQNIT